MLIGVIIGHYIVWFNDREENNDLICCTSFDSMTNENKKEERHF